MEKVRGIIGIILFGVAIYLGYNMSNPAVAETQTQLVETVDEEPEAPVEETVSKQEYDLPLDEFNVVRSKVKQNESLSLILNRYGIGYPEVHAAVNKSEGVFDVRKIMAGKKYTVFCDPDSSKEYAKCFVYEPNGIEYIVFDFRDSVTVYSGKREVTTEVKSVAGIINSSLYQTLENAGVSPFLAVKMSEIYAWSIDFYRIQKGDKFKLIYEQQYVEGKPFGVGKILAADFKHVNTDFYGFYFEQEGIGSYFDEKSKSLRKAFLKAPLKFSRISSRFSLKRFHPVQKRYKAHLGTDYAAPTGTPIMTVGDGKIVASAYNNANGNYVKVKHNGTYTTQYLHMSKRAKGMVPGKVVKQGDIIGYVGSTGLATGPHVCFRFWKNGKQVDPFKEKIPASNPIDKKYKATYEAEMKKWMKELDKINYEDEAVVVSEL